MQSTLTQLKAVSPNGQLPPSYGVYYKNTLVALCHALEDHILQSCPDDDGEKPLVLVTFQQGKWYLQEAERYGEIAKCSRHIAIAAMTDSGFATHPTGNLQNVDIVHLDSSDPLIQEWNLIIVAGGYCAMVLCRELTEEEYSTDAPPQEDSERKFYGLWTFDRPLVHGAAQILIASIALYNPSLAEKLARQQAEILDSPSQVPVDLTGVVSRIVTYLQTSQQKLVTVNRQTKEMADLEGQALRLNRNLTASKLQAFLRMAQRVDEGDPHNPVASLQVSALAETLAQILDLPTLRLRRLRLAGLLHRIGLAEAPREVFTQRLSQMNDASLAFWRERGVLASQLLATMPELDAIRKIILHHLEYWDGTGKPQGLKGEEISLESRILSLVAYFQAQTQPKGDRPALSLSEALEKCRSYSGTRFDPTLVESLSTVIDLTEVGLMKLPDRPTQLPTVWLEEINPSHKS
jgi:DICT domain-containing protein